MSTQSPTITSRFRKKLVSMNRTAKVALMISADLIALPFCFLIAMLLRLGDFESTLRYGVASPILIALLTISAFVMSGLYRAVIRFIDQRLLTTAGIGLAVVLLIAYFFSLSLNNRLPNSALMIYWFIAFSYVVTSRLMVRAFLRNKTDKRCQIENRVAIYGAGEPGAQLALAMRASDEYRPVCFFDEKHVLNKHTIAGITVFHSDRLLEIVKALGIGLVVIAIPSVSPDRLMKIMHMLRESGVPIKILRSQLELADDKISTQSIREIKIEDLLGRDQVPPQFDLFAKCVHGKNVLVTGAGGSIGSELCRQIMTLSPSRLHLIDHSEFALYSIKQELQSRFPSLPIQAHLGSVCSAPLVERIMQEGRIDTVYHAAAYKHVPLVEANIVEGIRNNVIGAEVIVAAAEKFRVETCVLISTDKAVRPTNIMGASKRIAELIFQAAAAKPGSGTTFCMVRFGNVLGSSGSVVPLFQHQIEHGGPITITHPDVVRYFMLIPEAAQLVIQAGAMAKGGDVFVLDMGEPIKIVDLARTMIAMSGFSEKNKQNPNGDIEMQFVGLRPGEKLYEELLIGDHASPSKHPRIMCTTEHALHHDELNQRIAHLIAACNTNDRTMIESMVRSIVTEYTPQTKAELMSQPNESSKYAAPSINKKIIARNA